MKNRVLCTVRLNVKSWDSHKVLKVVVRTNFAGSCWSWLVYGGLYISLAQNFGAFQLNKSQDPRLQFHWKVVQSLFSSGGTVLVLARAARSFRC